MDPITRARNGDTNFFKTVPVEYFQHVRAQSQGLVGSVLSISVEENHLFCTKAIIDRCPSLLTQIGVIFHFAAERGVPQIVKVLIDANVDNDEKIRLFMIKDGEGYRPLQVAVKYLQFEAFKLLLEAFPDHEFHFRNRGLTPLLLFILEQQHQTYGGRSSNHELVNMRRFLLEKFPSQGNIKAGDKGWTALHYAASEAQLDAIEDIIHFCPDSMNVVDNEGQNFLHIAADLDIYQVVEYVLQTKEIADRLLSVQNNSGDTPLDIAVKRGDKRTLRCLEASPTPNNEEEGEGMEDIENDSLIPLNQRELYRSLVKQFGNILQSAEPDKSTSLALSGFLSLVAEMREVDDVSEDQISEWENKVTDYSSLGLEITWFKKYLSLYRDRFQERGRLKDEMAIKEEAMERLREEYLSLDSEFDELQSRLDNLNCDDYFAFLDG
ncbi:hypothetical protein ACHQM5_015232 [Ranunculus cassubicifolius]